MPSSEEKFQHSYRDALKELKNNRLKNEVDLKTALASPATTPQAHLVLLEEYDRRMQEIIKSLTFERPEPDLVLQSALRALNRVEQFRFLLENLLDGVKRDDSLNNSLKRYLDLGLLDFQTAGKLAVEERSSPWGFNFGAGGLLRKLLDGLRNAALTLMEIVAFVMKEVPKFVGIKPSIGLSGPFPTFGLHFDVQAESITIHDLFEDLRQAIG